MRDWSRGQALGYYSIHPSHFDTRKPLHINDEDLCPSTLRVNANGLIAEQPMLSYTVHAIEIAALAREFVDSSASSNSAREKIAMETNAQVQILLNKKYEQFVAGLPSYFRLGSSIGLALTGLMAAILVHRWDVAPVTLDKAQLFNAAAVMLVDLLTSPEYKDADHSSAQLQRLMTRDKVRESIELIRTLSNAENPYFQAGRDTSSAQRSIVALEALMKLEEEESATDGACNATASSITRLGASGTILVYNANKSINTKVKRILDDLQANTTNTTNTLAMTEQITLTRRPLQIRRYRH
ncbi:MAG: hypothetical protein Q9210_004346 [Variospora velana]